MTSDLESQPVSKSSGNVGVQGRVQVDGARVFDGQTRGVKRLSVRFGGAKRDSLRLAALGVIQGSDGVRWR